VERSDTHQFQFAKVMGIAKRSTHPTDDARALHVIASASEAIHPAAERKNGLLRRFASRNDERGDMAI
jgi:hypothetical protein